MKPSLPVNLEDREFDSVRPFDLSLQRDFDNGFLDLTKLLRVNADDGGFGS